MATTVLIGGGMLVSSLVGYLTKKFIGGETTSTAESIDAHGVNNIIIREMKESFEVKGLGLFIVMLMLLVLKLAIVTFYLYRYCTRKFRNVDNKNIVSYRNREDVEKCESA